MLYLNKLEKLNKLEIGLSSECIGWNFLVCHLNDMNTAGIAFEFNVLTMVLSFLLHIDIKSLNPFYESSFAIVWNARMVEVTNMFYHSISDFLLFSLTFSLKIWRISWYLLIHCYSLIGLIDASQNQNSWFALLKKRLYKRRVSGWSARA